MSDIQWVPGAIRGLISHFTTMLTAMKAEKTKPTDTTVLSCYTYDQGTRSTEITVKDVEYFLQSMGQLIRDHADLRSNALVWHDVSERLPTCEKVNGFWEPVHVLIERRDGTRLGAVFTFHGGDDVYPEIQTPSPCFHTDEGIPYPAVIRWAAIPKRAKSR